MVQAKNNNCFIEKEILIMSNVIPILNTLPTSVVPADVEFFDPTDVLPYRIVRADPGPDPSGCKRNDLFPPEGKPARGALPDGR